MAEVKRFIVLDDEGQIVQQTDSMTIEVDAGVTARSVVNKTQLDTVASDAATAITSEQTRAQTSEAALGDSISNLQSLIADLSSGTAGDLTVVNTRITQEISDRTEDVNSEEARAIAAEAALQALIDAEVLARTAADTAEAAARDAADVALGLRIDGETAARESLDTTLRGLISAEEAARIAADSSLNVALAQEITDRATADTALQTNITAEVTAREAADVILQTNINNEATTRETADIALQTEINAEETRALNAEAALQTALDGEISTRGSEITRVEGLISAEITARATADTAEAATRLAADTALAADLAAETDRATSEEARIESKYDTGIAAEITAREAGDLANTAAISAEASRAVAAETVLTNSLTAEIARATTREDAIETALNTERTRAIDEEIAVENRAKAYADARVQGLKPKDSVDMGFVRFMPRWHMVTRGESSPDYEPAYRFGVANADIGCTENQEVAFPSTWAGTEYAPNIRFSPNLGGMVIPYKVITVDGVTSYTLVGENLDDAGIDSAVDQAGSMNDAWSSIYVPAGWRTVRVKLEVVDILEGNNFETFLTGMAGLPGGDSFGVLLAQPKTRVVIVQPDFGRWAFDGSPETLASNPEPFWNYYLVSDEIAALPVEEQDTARAERYDNYAALGIYERTVTGGVATWARAPDFATSAEVSGAMFVVEKSVRGAVMHYGPQLDFPGYARGWWRTVVSTYPAALHADNTAVIVRNRTIGAPSAVVGTDELNFVLFNRAGAYSFGNGLYNDDISRPTHFSVKADESASMRVNPDGVRLAVAGPHLEHKLVDPLSGYGPTELRVVGPLVNGEDALLDGHALHSHGAAQMRVRMPWEQLPSLEGGTYDARTVELGAAVKSALINPTGTEDVQSVAPATWDSPDYVGVFNFAREIRPSNPTNYSFGLVAVSGSIAMPWQSHAALATFTVGEMVYVGETAGTFAKYADIPSGKWAVPVGIFLGDAEWFGQNLIRLVDRPAFLKA